MGFIALIIVLGVLGNALEAVGGLFYMISSVMHSSFGTVITVAVAAWAAYRWYRGRHTA